MREILTRRALEVRGRVDMGMNMHTRLHTCLRKGVAHVVPAPPVLYLTKDMVNSTVMVRTVLVLEQKFVLEECY
jgi:hypothetical protein